jgi:hypothetical protein
VQVTVETVDPQLPDSATDARLLKIVPSLSSKSGEVLNNILVALQGRGAQVLPSDGTGNDGGNDDDHEDGNGNDDDHGCDGRTAATTKLSPPYFVLTSHEVLESSGLMTTEPLCQFIKIVSLGAAVTVDVSGGTSGGGADIYAALVASAVPRVVCTVMATVKA